MSVTTSSSTFVVGSSNVKRIVVIGIDDTKGLTETNHRGNSIRRIRPPAFLIPIPDSLEQLREKVEEIFWPTDDEPQHSQSTNCPPTHIRLLMEEGSTFHPLRPSLKLSWGGEIRDHHSFKLIRDNDHIQAIRMIGRDNDKLVHHQPDHMSDTLITPPPATASLFYRSHTSACIAEVDLANSPPPLENAAGTIMSTATKVNQTFNNEYKRKYGLKKRKAREEEQKNHIDIG